MRDRSGGWIVAATRRHVNTTRPSIVSSRMGRTASTELTDIDRVPADWPNREFSRRVVQGGVDWHVQVAGRGPVVVLLHGTGASSHSWADVVPRLRDHATVVVPDLPGHAYTRGDVHPMGLVGAAAALERLLAAIGAGSPRLLVGHSAGAALALELAISGGHEHLPVLGFNPSLVPPPPTYMRLVAPLVTPIATAMPTAAVLSRLARRPRLVAGLLQSTRSRIPEAQELRYAALLREPSHVRGTMRFMAGTDLPSLLRRVRAHRGAQTFVVGSRDAWVREVPLRAILARAMPRATIERWPGGHILHEEFPERAADLVLRCVGASGDR